MTKWPAEKASTLNAAFGKKLGLENQHIDQGAPLFVPVAIQGAATRENPKSGPQCKGFRDDGKAYTLEARSEVQMVCAPVTTAPYADNASQESRLVCSQYGDKAAALTARHDFSPCADRGMTIVGTLNASGAGTSRPAGQGNELDFCVPVMAIHPHCIGRAPHAGPQGKEYLDNGKAYTMDTKAPQAVLAPTILRMRSGCEGGGKGALLSEDKSLTLATGNDQTLFVRHGVRRLTPRECERLQGFPDDYTAIPWGWWKRLPQEILERSYARYVERCRRRRQKPLPWGEIFRTSDGPRYKALGNSMAVPVVRWLGERIARVEEIYGTR